MNGRNNNEKSATDNDDADGMAGPAPYVPRRVSSCPLPLAPGILTDTQAELICAVIALVEEAHRAEALRARRRPPSEFGDCRLPDFGSDISDYMPTPQTRKAETFIDSLSPANMDMLLAALNAGRDQMSMTPSNVAWLLSHARGSGPHLGSYMLSKTKCAVWLKEGLRKFERYTARMIRRGIR